MRALTTSTSFASYLSVAMSIQCSACSPLHFFFTACWKKDPLKFIFCNKSYSPQYSRQPVWEYCPVADASHRAACKRQWWQLPLSLRFPGCQKPTSSSCRLQSTPRPPWSAGWGWLRWGSRHWWRTKIQRRRSAAVAPAPETLTGPHQRLKHSILTNRQGNTESVEDLWKADYLCFFFPILTMVINGRDWLTMDVSATPLIYHGRSRNCSLLPSPPSISYTISYQSSISKGMLNHATILEY